MNIIDAGVVWDPNTKEIIVGKWNEIKLLKIFTKSLQFDVQNRSGFAREKEALHNMYSSYIMLITEYGADPIKVHEIYSVLDEYAAHACGYLRSHFPVDQY